MYLEYLKSFRSRRAAAIFCALLSASEATAHADEPTSAAASQPAGQSASQQASQPAGQPASQPAGQPASQPASQPAGQPELDKLQSVMKAPAPVRAGVVLGGSLGFALGSAAGYPNDVRLNGNPEFYGQTPAMPGYSFNLFFMGALTPYLNVGFWGGAASFANAEWQSRGGGGGLRIEGFPLMAVCGCAIPASFSNFFGVYGMAGVGSTSTDVKRSGNYQTIGGVQSYLAAGAFYELKLGRLLTMGPDLRYEVIASWSSDRNALVAGLRIALYPAN